ncbi:acetoin utilization protein AcuC [Primorskyibacter aestuariivivens]|uniref:acetoin utilization protein AcuC n=1 Tax=Primorskyibacter aestuariivivens TaxID=1888912 RepID=UPI002300812B|nr:acetoin utilization protein AcuC [Primorskyibacter aestuariivivens]MDA7428936.1 acetoin utilization protein AcuC [Primorskyibacter aestuariivivens]
MSGPLFIGSNIYRGSSYGARHPLSIPRVPTVIDLCRVMGWLGPDCYRTSPRAKPVALTLFHDADYIAALQRAEARQSVNDDTRTRHGLGTLSNPVFAEMYRRPATAAGGSMLGASLLANGGVVFNPGGGTHHGMPGRAAGFCYLNDPALAIMQFRAMGLTRILYVDIDAHHCDGVEAGFAGAGDLRMISVHEDQRWPFTGAFADRAGGAALNLPVPRGVNDSEFAHLRDQVILPAVERLEPQAIVLQCGADAVTEDPLARLELSNNVHFDMVARLREMTPRLLVLGGGGYNPWSVGRLWSGVWATLAGQEIPDHLPKEAQEVLEALTWLRQRGPVPGYLTGTLRDAPRPGPVRTEVEALAEAAGGLVQGWRWGR